MPEENTNKAANPITVADVLPFTRAEKNKAARAAIATERTKEAADELAALLPYYTEKALTVFKVICNKHNGAIALEVFINEYPVNRNHTDGLLVVPLGNALLSYRARLDNTMGYSCNICSNNSVLAPEEDSIRTNPTTPPHIIDQIKAKISKRPATYEDTAFTRERVK